MKTISVYVTDVLVPDYAAQMQGANRFIGRGPLPERAKLEGPFTIPLTKPEDEKEYVKHVQRGELVAADAATAAICGVPFESPTKSAKGSK
jgi:hypothetical protein